MSERATAPHRPRPDRAHTRIGRYAIAPLWLTLDQSVKDFWIRVFNLLAARYADFDDHTCSPSRKQLAEDLHCSTSTIDVALKGLEAAGALIITPQYDERGDRTANLYTVVFDHPPTEKSVDPPPEKSGYPSREIGTPPTGISVDPPHEIPGDLSLKSERGLSKTQEANKEISVQEQYNPPTPLGKGAPLIRRDDRKRAEDFLRQQFGKCPHDPPCESGVECRATLAADFAVRRHSAERDALAFYGGNDS